MNKSDLKLMEDWREKQITMDIPINMVQIINDEHKNGIEEGFINKPNNVSVYSDGRQIPIVVKPIYDSKDYELLYGLGQLKKVKKLNCDSISAVIVNEGRDELISKLNRDYKDYWKLSDIKIPKSFKESKPSPFKVIHKARLMMGGVVDPITVDYESKYLTDGYITYLLLKFRGVARVEVKLQ